MTFFSDYRIAAGWNVVLGSLVNIESILPNGDTYRFRAPQAYGLYNVGQNRIRGDGLVYVAGYASVTWRFGVMTRLQYEYLRTTYCNGGFSGKVTILTTLGSSAYSRMNASMILPTPAGTDGAFYGFRNYDVFMTRLVASV